MKHVYFYIFILLLLVGTGFAYHNSTTHTETETDTRVDLRFSNTQAWDPDLLALSVRKGGLVPDATDVIHVAEYPPNNSNEAEDELATLHALMGERTSAKRAEIASERNIEYTYFGEKTFGELTSPVTYPHTAVLLQTAYTDILPVLLHFKKQFDRVRPNVLDTTLQTSIPVPGHPAYPSGHATQSYLVALILSDLDPTHTEDYISSSYRIAHNREIAGLHYPSDSEAGRSLAQQYYDLLSQTEWYKIHLEEALTEWQSE